MDIRLGMDAKLYHGPAGSTATSELTNTRDVTLNLETGEADATTRGSGGWRAIVATLKEGTVGFEMVWDMEDTGLTRQTAVAFAWSRAGVVGVR